MKWATIKKYSTGKRIYLTIQKSFGIIIIHGGSMFVDFMGLAHKFTSQQTSCKESNWCEMCNEPTYLLKMITLQTRKVLTIHLLAPTNQNFQSSKVVYSFLHKLCVEYCIEIKIKMFWFLYPVKDPGFQKSVRNRSIVPGILRLRLIVPLNPHVPLRNL